MYYFVTDCTHSKSSSLLCAADDDDKVAPDKSCVKQDLKKRKVLKILTEVANIQCRAITLLLTRR